MAEVEDLLEPGTNKEASHRSYSSALFSMAISLKRIADTLEAIQKEPCNNYGETALPALARAISDGIAGRA